MNRLSAPTPRVQQLTGSYRNAPPPSPSLAVRTAARPQAACRPRRKATTATGSRIVAQLARSANKHICCSFIRFSISPRAQYTSSYSGGRHFPPPARRHEPRVAPLGQLLGLADHPTRAAPTLPRLVGELLEDPAGWPVASNCTFASCNSRPTIRDRSLAKPSTKCTPCFRAHHPIDRPIPLATAYSIASSGITSPPLRVNIALSAAGSIDDG